MGTYCQFVRSKAQNDIHRQYHDREYGFPLSDDNELFGRLLLEINQAGLSWTTILNKKTNFRLAYSNFNIRAVAAYSQKDRERLLKNSGIIRNKLKVNAAIYNAQQILTIQEEDGSFVNWLDSHYPLSREEWVKLFKRKFKFTGGEITNEFLLSTGYLAGAHNKACPVYNEIVRAKPRWMS